MQKSNKFNKIAIGAYNKNAYLCTSTQSFSAMLLKNVLILACLLCMASCDSCPEHNSPTMSVIFQGDFKIKNVYGIGGGRILPSEFMNSNYQIAYELELAVTHDTTAYVIEHSAGKDTLVVHHTVQSFYESNCGLYMSVKNLEARFPATTFPKNKVNVGGKQIIISK